MSLSLRESRMSSYFWVFVTEVFHHWIALVTGSAVSLGILTWEKRQKTEVKWKTITTIFLAGLALSLFFAWEDEYTSAEWREGEIYRLSGLLLGENSQIQSLQSQLVAKDRPINLQVQPDPEIHTLLARQDAELLKLKGELPSPKKKALQLSNDILRFLSDRMKTKPNPPIFNGTANEQRVQMSNEFEQSFLKWMSETASEYQIRFGPGVSSIIDDAQSAGLSAENIKICIFSNGNTFEIQECGSRIGALADKLP
jgi:hypothetical protein